MRLRDIINRIRSINVEESPVGWLVTFSADNRSRRRSKAASEDRKTRMQKRAAPKKGRSKPTVAKRKVAPVKPPRTVHQSERDARAKRRRKIAESSRRINRRKSAA